MPRHNTKDALRGCDGKFKRELKLQEKDCSACEYPIKRTLRQSNKFCVDCGKMLYEVVFECTQPRSFIARVLEAFTGVIHDRIHGGYGHL